MHRELDLSKKFNDAQRKMLISYWSEKYEELEKDYEMLESANESLREKNKELSKDYNELKAEVINKLISSFITYCQEANHMI